MSTTAAQRILCASSLALITLVWISGCRNGSTKPPPAKPAEVIVSLSTTKEITDLEEFTGRLEAFKKVDIQARVTGYLEKVNFQEGTKVTKGDVLFEIDPRPYQADLDKVDAAAVLAQARAKRLEGDFARAQELFRGKSLSREEFGKVSGDYAEAQASLGVAKAGQTAAQLFLKYTKVVSPITGMVGRSFLDHGNLVKADTTILTTVVTQNPMYAYFDVDERTLYQLRRVVGQGASQALTNTFFTAFLAASTQHLAALTHAATAKVTVPVRMGLAEESNFPRTGALDFEDNALDPNTGTLRLRGVFNNPDGFLVPGMFVRIRYQVGLPRLATVVPEQGVGTDQSQKYVYVVNSKKEVEYRKVKAGPLVEGLRVIEQGVAPGEQIIVSGLQRVRPMAKVEPLLEPMPNVKAHEPPKTNLPVKDR